MRLLGAIPVARLALCAALGAPFWNPAGAAAQPPSRTLTTLHNFTGQNGDGAFTVGGVVRDANGSLYGTTEAGGAFSTSLLNGCGTVFQLKPPGAGGGAWSESIIHSFQCTGDGAAPSAGVVLANDGSLYGATYYGGLAGCSDNLGCGVVFRLTPPAVPGGTWTQHILYRFTGGADGANPEGGIAIGAGGAIYGTTIAGGSGTNPLCGSVPGGCGTVFELTPPAAAGADWTETVLHSFAGGADGSQPKGGAPLIVAGGAIYGTTQIGGGAGCYGFGCGTVFELTPPASPGAAWTETLPHIFNGGFDGVSPIGTLALGSNGVLYGTTILGGGGSCPEISLEGCGAVFSLAASETIIYSSAGGTNGAYPFAGLVVGGGALYGADAFGGPANASCPNTACGTLFELTPPAAPGGTWTAESLHRFNGADGSTPFGALAMGADGAFYGTTYYGGTANDGTVFKLVP